MNIKEKIYNGISNEIKKWNFEDIYAISFYVLYEDDDPRNPVVIVGFNTIKNWIENIDSASDEQEAKWNYAFWLQNEGYLFGCSDNDKEFTKEWIKELNLFYTDEEEDQDFDRCMELGKQIDIAFNEVCVQIAREIHKNILPSLTDNKIPILVHELEYYDKIIEQNKLANPNGEADEFIEWIYSTYG